MALADGALRTSLACTERSEERGASRGMEMEEGRERRREGGRRSSTRQGSRWSVWVERACEEAKRGV
eukprot:2265144-Rhodomonas_salina.3